jgi:hypothetical protein
VLGVAYVLISVRGFRFVLCVCLVYVFLTLLSFLTSCETFIFVVVTVRAALPLSSSLYCTSSSMFCSIYSNFCFFVHLRSIPDSFP